MKNHRQSHRLVRVSGQGNFFEKNGVFCPTFVRVGVVKWK